MPILTTIPRDELDALHTRIRQLEDEVARLRAVNESTRAGRAFRLFESWLRGGCPRIDCEGRYAERFVNEVITLEQALATQAEREKANG